MFDRIGRLVVRRSRRILVLAGIALVVFAGLGVHASSKLLNEGYTSASAQSQVVTDMLGRDFGGAGNLLFLVESRFGTVDSPAVAQAGERLSAQLATQPGVGRVSSYWSTHAPDLRSRDGRDALVVVSLPGSTKGVNDRAKPLISRFQVGAGAPGPVTVLAGGAAADGVALDQQVNKSLSKAEAVAIPLTALLLVLAFGSVVSALLPVALGVVAIFATLFVLWLLGSLTNVSVYAINVTTAMGLGLGIDYSLLMVSRYREELAGGLLPADAVKTSIATAGRTIVFSAATVAAALAALIAFPVYFLRSFAYAGISVVAVAMVGALVVLPALLVALGPRVNALTVPWRRNRLSGDVGKTEVAESRFWGGVAQRVMAQPARTALPVIAVLVLVALPFASVHWGSPDDRVVPTSVAVRQVGDALRTQFPNNAMDALDVVTSRRLDQTAAATYSRELSSLAGVTQVTGPGGRWVHGAQVGPAVAGHQAPQASWFSALITPDTESNAAATLVHEARALPPPAGVTASVGGAAAQLVDQKHDLGSKLPLALLLMVITTFVVLFLFTGSVVLPVKALVLNALSLTAVFGMIVWVFQEGHLSGILGFTPTSTSTTMPLLVFVIAFGLSMDYEVFLLSRIKELHDAGLANDEAVAGGLARTGRILTTAAGLLAVTFFAFGLSDVTFLKLFGVGTAVAILVDATLIRGVLVPAFMKVAGPINWWAPAPLRRLYRRIGFAEAAAKPAERVPEPVS
jgi:putative drug exporter of the RND superfamily